MESISSSSLQMIFTYLDIGEISRLCHTNYFFDRVCRAESLWKNILRRDYSIVEKNNNVTWRSKAKKIFIDSNIFWKGVNYNIDYYMKHHTNFRSPELSLIDNFEKNLVN